MEKEKTTDFRKIIARGATARRKRQEVTYDPVKGIGCHGQRTKVDTGEKRDGVCLLPVSLIEDNPTKRHEAASLM